jgi:hypothetical protein
LLLSAAVAESQIERLETIEIDSLSVMELKVQGQWVTGLWRKFFAFSSFC